jgi:hypothetical protein
MTLDEDALVVRLALVHGERKPGYWKRRLRLVPEK